MRVRTHPYPPPLPMCDDKGFLSSVNARYLGILQSASFSAWVRSMPEEEEGEEEAGISPHSEEEEVEVEVMASEVKGRSMESKRAAAAPPPSNPLLAGGQSTEREFVLFL